MIKLEDVVGWVGLLTAMLAAMSVTWRWHTSEGKKIQRFVDVLDAAIFIIATVAAILSLWVTMGGHVESMILAAFLAFLISVVAVIASGLAAFGVRNKMTKAPGGD